MPDEQSPLDPVDLRMFGMMQYLLAAFRQGRRRSRSSREASSSCRDTMPPRPQPGKVVPLTTEQVDALVEAALDRYRALVVLGCGQRPAAWQSLRGQDRPGVLPRARI
jgi:hypothetical protein